MAGFQKLTLLWRSNPVLLQCCFLARVHAVCSQIYSRPGKSGSRTRRLSLGGPADLTRLQAVSRGTQRVCACTHAAQLLGVFIAAAHRVLLIWCCMSRISSSCLTCMHATCAGWCGLAERRPAQYDEHRVPYGRTPRGSTYGNSIACWWPVATAVPGIWQRLLTHLLVNLYHITSCCWYSQGPAGLANDRT